MNFKTLFNIHIHHGYFLDKGNEKYLKVDEDDTEMEDDDKAFALKEYQLSDYLEVIPSGLTKAYFRNYRMTMRPHASGFRILINTLKRTVGPDTKYEPLIPLEEDVYITFEIKAKDPYFYNYSDVFDLSDSTLYLFTNVEPANQEAEFENLFENNGGLIDSRFLLKEAESRELLKAIALEDENFLAYKTGTISLGRNIRIIQNHAHLTNEQKDTEIEHLLNQVIQKRKKKQTLGYIRLRVNGDAADRHLVEYIDENQYVKDSTPTFTISFINQKTYWRFISEADEATLTTKQKKWLSKNGAIEITSSDFDAAGLDPPDTDPEDYVFPNPTVDLIKKEDNNYYSEIFI
jgi:hypothetical protein